MRPQSLRTLRLRGGPPIEVQIPGNPTLQHNGRTSVCSLVLSDEEVVELRQFLESQGLAVDIWDVVGQSVDQERERRLLNEIPDRVWPCGSCPTCSWLDPLTEDPCGFRSLPLESVEVLLRESSAHQESLRSCDLKVKRGIQGWDGEQ